MSSLGLLLLQWHPDKNPAPGAKAKFVTLATAMEVLSGNNRPSVVQAQCLVSFIKHDLNHNHQMLTNERPTTFIWLILKQGLLPTPHALALFLFLPLALTTWHAHMHSLHCCAGSTTEPNTTAMQPREQTGVSLLDALYAFHTTLTPRHSTHH